MTEHDDSTIWPTRSTNVESSRSMLLAGRAANEGYMPRSLRGPRPDISLIETAVLETFRSGWPEAGGPSDTVQGRVVLDPHGVSIRWFFDALLQRQ